ncbi:MAG TPA: asparagine synthase-related protein, partial [Gemmatimonadota bacterium]|nr:asparagine synthase-related protein [Gemmatimonadota bacterium]
ATILPSPGLQYLLDITDSIAGAFGMETRCPFLDRRLVEFCLAVPSEQKLANGWTRVILRRAMEGILPPEIQWRVHKADLAYSFIRRLRGLDRQALITALFDAPFVLEDYVDMDLLRAIHKRFDSGGIRHVRRDSGRLYIAAVLSRWLRGVHAERQRGAEPQTVR